MIALYASAGTVVITPRGLPVAVGGMGLGSVAHSVRDDLECNAVLLRLSDLPPIALVSLDLLYVGPQLRTAIMERLGPSWPEESVFLAASHTHYAPSVDPSKPLLGEVDPDYVDFVAEAVVALLGKLAAKQGLECELVRASGRYRLGVSRRRRRVVRLTRKTLQVNKVAMGPNPTGQVDDVVTAVCLKSAERPIAVIWSAACHPTSLPPPLAVSAHFPGVVRSGVRTALWGEDSGPVIFLQGFSGDVRPPSVDPMRSAAGALRRLRLGPTFGDFSEKHYDVWASGIAGFLVNLLSEMRPTQSGRLRAIRILLEREELVQLGEARSPMSLHGIALGDVTIMGGSAEFVSDYARIVRESVPDGTIIPVGCIDDVLGYIPTSEMIPEGGYEVDYHCKYFGNRGSKVGAQRVVENAFRDLGSALT